MSEQPNSFDGVGDEFADKMAAAGMGSLDPATTRDRGEGPFRRLILRGATVIDGTGAPPWSPADIIIEGGRIAAVIQVGSPGVPIEASRRPAPRINEIEAEVRHDVIAFTTTVAEHIGDAESSRWLHYGLTSTDVVDTAQALQFEGGERDYPGRGSWRWVRC